MSENFDLIIFVKRNSFLRDYVAIIWGSGGIAVMGAGRGVGPKKLFIVHMTWSTGYQTSPPPRGGISQHLPIFASNMPVFSHAHISHGGVMGVRPHGTVPHFCQFSIRDWHSGRGLILIKPRPIHWLELPATIYYMSGLTNWSVVEDLLYQNFMGYPLVVVWFQGKT